MPEVVINLKNRSKHSVVVGAKPIKKDEERLYLIGASSKASVCCKTAGLERKHCVVRIRGSDVFVHDLAKKGDVQVNGDTIVGKARLLPGDQLKVGELCLDVSIRRRGETEVKSGIPANAEDDVSSWLMEEDERERQERIANPAAAARKVDTSTMPGEKIPSDDELDSEAENEAAAAAAKAAAQAADSSGDSVEAAEDFLSKKYNSINFRR
jgi:predicted component of type VI protein secretion system